MWCGRKLRTMNSTTATAKLRSRAAHPTASNVDYWAFRCRPDAEAADDADRAERRAAAEAADERIAEDHAYHDGPRHLYTGCPICNPRP